jgi:type I restriction enzyme S subunit
MGVKTNEYEVLMSVIPFSELNSSIGEIQPSYKRTELGVIPQDWKIYTLFECAKRITDGEHQTPKRKTTGYYLLSARNILNGRIDLSDVDFVGEHEYHRIRQRCNPEAGDILISCSGSVGRVALLPKELNCVMVRSAALVKPREIISALFTQYFLQSSVGQKQIMASLNQAAQANLFLNHIQNLRIALPPTKEEQEAIGAALSDADALIESLEQLIAKKSQIKQGAMQELLTGKKRLPGFETIPGYKQTESGMIPEDWNLQYIEHLAHITTGSRNTQDRVDDAQYPFFVRSQTVERINSYSFDGEAVLTAGDGVGTGKVFHYINGKFDTHQRVYRIANFSSQINGYFFYLYFSSHFYNRIMQMTAKSSVDSVRMEMIAKMLIPLPPTMAEQDSIAAILSDMEEEITSLETKLTKAQQIKQGMMQELLTGRIRLI